MSLRREWLDPVMIVITSTGLGWVQLLLLVACARREGWRRVAILALWAGALSGLLRLGVMRIADRQRPSNFEWSSPLENVRGNSSFPSGHATTSFAIAFMVILLVRNTEYKWVGWATLGWALLVGYSRVYVGVHYPLDILGAACMGATCAGLAHISVEKTRFFAEPAAVLADFAKRTIARVTGRL